MKRRDFIAGLAGMLAASKVLDVPNVGNLFESVPASARLLIPIDRSFFVDHLTFFNQGVNEFVRPELSIAGKLFYTGFEIQRGQAGNVDLGRYGYQLEADEPVILVGQPGACVVLSGVSWQIPKTREHPIDPTFYSYFVRI